MNRSPIQFDAKESAIVSFVALHPHAHAKVRRWLKPNSKAARVVRILAEGCDCLERSKQVRDTAAYFKLWAEEYVDTEFRVASVDHPSIIRRKVKP